MDGIFLKPAKALITVMIIVDVIIVGVFGVQFYADPYMSLLIGAVIFLVFFDLLMGVILILMNVNPFLHIDLNEKRISGSVAWGKKLDCPLKDVGFVETQMNMLRILLKNGKLYEVPSLMNAPALSTAIKKSNFELEKESPETVEGELKKVYRTRSKWIVCTVIAGVLALAAISLGAFLTDGQDSGELSTTVNIVSIILLVLLAAAFVLAFISADKIGKSKLFVQWQKERLRSARVLASPLSTTQVKQVLTDEYFAGRVTVCGFPNEENVYYTVEKFNNNDELENVFSSEVFDKIENLPQDLFAGLFDVTEQYFEYVRQ